jgi:hypothetical protein
MDDEFDKSRDVETDLVEITSRLGEPDSVHRTSAAGVAWRFVLGVVIVIGAATLHYLMWTETVPWPRARHWKLWVLLLIAMFVGPGVGLYLIGFAVRGLKMWVLSYPTGLFVWHRGRVLAFPWDEVRAVQITGLPDKAALNRPDGEATDAYWYDLTRSGRRVFGTTITLTRADGEQVGLPSTLGDFAGLGRRVQEETYRRLFPTAWDDVRAGQLAAFGPVSCGPGGLTIGKETLPWDQVGGLVRAQDKLEVRRVGKKKAWNKVDVSDLINPHVLMGLADAARPATAEPDALPKGE